MPLYTTLPTAEFNRFCKMALHQGWYATRQHMHKQGYSQQAIATILIATLYEMGGTCSLENFML